MKINEIRPDKHKFLQILGSIDVSPTKLYYFGALPAERRPTIAVVGSRHPTSYGRAVTTQLVGELARQGIVVVSGLALGVDALAHQAALDAGGTTIAIVPSALPDIRPWTNRRLAERIIAEGGAVLSERIDGDGKIVGKWSFLERNRLVSGLADAVLITEAGDRSGTLNTAMHAIGQGREVLVVPGNITSPMSAGCNKLIRQGATPVTSASDIIQLAFPRLASGPRQLPLGANPTEAKIIDILAKNGVLGGDQLAAQAGLAPAELAITLSILEINGIVHPLGANRWGLR